MSSSTPLRELPTVREFMATGLKTIPADMPILKAVDFLLKHKVSGSPVVDGDQKLVGIISEKDCLAVMIHGGADHDIPTGTVAEYMSKTVNTLPPDMDIYYAAGRFLKHVYRRFPVVEDGRLVGQISRRDLLRAIQKYLR